MDLGHHNTGPFEEALQCSKWVSARAQQLCMIRWPFLSRGADVPSDDPPIEEGKKGGNGSIQTYFLSLLAIGLEGVE